MDYWNIADVPKRPGAKWLASVLVGCALGFALFWFLKDRLTEQQVILVIVGGCAAGVIVGTLLLKWRIRRLPNPTASSDPDAEPGDVAAPED